MLTLKKVPDRARFAVNPPWATATPVAPKAASPAVSATAVFFQLNFPVGSTFHQWETVNVKLLLTSVSRTLWANRASYKDWRSVRNDTIAYDLQHATTL